MSNLFPRARGNADTPPTTLLQHPQPQKVVPDVVKTQPVRDPYAELSRASDRLTAGKSIFESVLSSKKLQTA